MKFTAILACTLAVLAQNVAGQATNTSTPAAPAADPANLPTFTYTLTTLPVGERDALCSRNKGFCVTSCGNATPPMNFCNSTTMAWGCGCINKVPDFQGHEWPINFAHCQGSGAACEKACTAGDTKCLEACRTKWSSSCGTTKQPPAYYRTEDVNQVPTYAAPSASTANSTSNSTSSSTSSSNSSNSSTSTKSTSSANSGLAFNFGSAISALAVVAAGMMML